MGGETTSSRSSTSSYPKLAERPVGKKIANLYKDRLNQFLDQGQYQGDGLMSKLYYGRVSGEPAIKLSIWSAPGQDRPTFKHATSQTFKPTSTGIRLGPSWATHWFKVLLTVPADLRKANKDHLEFHWNSNTEALIWSEKGEPLQGLTGGGERECWIFPESFADGKEHMFYVEVACNAMFGNALGDNIQPPTENNYFTFDKAEIVAIDEAARGLHMDFRVIGDAAREFPEDSWEEHQALMVANEIMDCFIAGNGTHDSIVDCRKIATKYIGDSVDSSKVYDDGPQPSLVNGIGQCHIDTCWLWPWDETKRKVARSWANQCNLIDQFPEHRFACSQAQQYKWLEMYYPALYDRVKTKVKEGSFQPIGGSWVEHDTNMPSGESLVRQFVYGQRLFESHFGQRSTTFWLPDTFGYSSQIPQLCRLAGMSRFFTQKLSWNNINKFPHTTFNWVALDGSQVLCHMAPSETYTAEANFGDVRRSITQHKSMDQDATSLLVFGKGDGGGGPTWEQLERLRRCRGISDTVGLLPRLKMGNSVEDFFAKIEKKVENGTELVTWYGELYFELHRGTYTTQSNNKRNNRKAEIMLHDIELLATMASLKNGGDNDYQYPKKDIDDMWEATLLCQFHDCLPGSCIEMCYDDSDKLYKTVFETGEKLLSGAMSALGFVAPNSHSPQYAINTLPWTRPNLTANVPGASSLLNLAQHTPANSTPSVIVAEITKGVFQMESSAYKIQVREGLITSLFDKHASREVVPKGAAANQYVIFDDKPIYWQAWDVEVFHLDSRKVLSNENTTVLEHNDKRVVLATETHISDNSWIKTTITLNSSDSSEPPIAINAEVEWNEDKKFLKVEFPVDVYNTVASYETQFGIVRRPTHYNTNWDMAKFEVCCHKWADLSESNYGVSILNDSKYGFATVGNVMRLSLLRAPKAPDAHADMGRHHINWGILPHSGPLDHRTIRAGFEFNAPLASAPQYFKPGSSAAAPSALFPFTNTTSYIRGHPEPEQAAKMLSAVRMSEDSDPAIILDTIKRGEDDEDVMNDVITRNIPTHATADGTDDLRSGASILPSRKGRSVVVRMYDSLGGKARGRVVLGGEGTGWKVGKVFKCNLLEDDGEEVETSKGERGSVGFGVELRPFEVASFRCEVS